MRNEGGVAWAAAVDVRIGYTCGETDPANGE